MMTTISLFNIYYLIQTLKKKKKKKVSPCDEKSPCNLFVIDSLNSFPI